MILASVLVSAAVALGPAPAPATLTGDVDAAAAYWQTAPADCSTTAVSSVRLSREKLGEATIPNSGQRTPCVMKIARGLSPRLRCLVVVHEYGHWLGLGHSSDRHSPMFPAMDPKMAIPQCEKA